MHTLNAIPAPNEADVEDALKVLGRVADAFDNPSLHKTDKELKLLMVNVVKSRRLLTSFPSEESLCRDASQRPYDSSSDEEEGWVELGNADIWEHAASYPYAPRGCPSHKQRNRADRNTRQEEGTHEVTKMLLTSSPLDRLDRLARMELRKTGWIERVDKWTIVEMGLQGVPQTPPKTPVRRANIHTRESWEDFSSTRTMLVNDGKRTARLAKTGFELGYDTPERGHRQIKPMTPVSMRSTVDSQDSRCLADFSTLSHPKTPVRGRSTARGRLGQAVRNIVKRMLPPSTAGYGRARCKDERVSVESGWTFGTASSWMEVDYVVY